MIMEEKEKFQGKMINWLTIRGGVKGKPINKRFNLKK